MATLEETKKAIEERKAKEKARKQRMYDKGYQAGLNQYGKQATGSGTPKLDKFMREKMHDPLINMMGPSDYDLGDRQARKDVLGYKKGGSTKSSASKRADGCAQRGKTKGKMV